MIILCKFDPVAYMMKGYVTNSSLNLDKFMYVINSSLNLDKFMFSLASLEPFATIASYKC